MQRFQVLKQTLSSVVQNENGNPRSASFIETDTTQLWFGLIIPGSKVSFNATAHTQQKTPRKYLLTSHAQRGCVPLEMYSLMHKTVFLQHHILATEYLQKMCDTNYKDCDPSDGTVHS